MSRFERGHPKVGGRKKGTPNRATRIRESLAAKDVDLGSMLLKFISKTSDEALELKAIELLVKYNEPVPTAASDAKAPGFEIASDASTEDLLEGLI